MSLILASGSPRRASVLEQLGLEFEIRSTDVDERLEADERPENAVERLARAKAASVARVGSVALGFDTLVAIDERILGKPAGPDEALVMLEALAGREHAVHTGVAAAVPDRIESAVETTLVRLREASRDELAAYVATREPLDKAGAYGIQGYGAALVASIEGDYFNVMGFPVQPVQRLLRRFGRPYDFGHLAGRTDPAS